MACVKSAHDHLDELLVVDLAITIDVSLADHLIDLLVGHVLSEIEHDVLQLSSGDKTVPISVEYLKCVQNLLFGVPILGFLRHHGDELGEIDGAVPVHIDHSDHVVELGVGGMLTKGLHNSTQLNGSDGTVAIPI